MVMLSDIPNMFWGVTLEGGGKKYTQTVERAFHISMAALEPIPGSKKDDKDNKFVSVMVQHDRAEFLICTLEPGRLYNQQLDLNFTDGEEVTFFLNGKGIVHLTGYLVEDEEEMPVEEDESEDSDYEPPELLAIGDDDSEPDSSDEEEELEAMSGKRKMPDSSSSPKKKKKQKIMVMEEADDDEEEDDEEEEDEDDDDPGQFLDMEATEDNEWMDDDEEDDDAAEEEDDDEDELSYDDIFEKKGKAKQQKKKDKGSPSKKQDQTPSKQQDQPTQNGDTTEKKKKKKKKKKNKNKGDETPGNTPQSQSKTNSVITPQQKTPSQSPGGSSKKPKKHVLEGGLIVEEMKEGHGPEAKNGKMVHAYYKGSLHKTGKVFDSSLSGKPFKFKMGKKEVIQGWDLGFKGMKVGGKRRLIVPPKLAYGGQRAGSIPPNSTLVFDVELKGVS